MPDAANSAAPLSSALGVTITMLIETWNKKYSHTPTKQITGVLSVSFSYRRALGPRSEAGELTISISGSAGEPTYKSKVVWPQDNYESQVIEGITDAMYQFSQSPLAVTVIVNVVVACSH